jgi:hypothetical protein
VPQDVLLLYGNFYINVGPRIVILEIAEEIAAAHISRVNRKEFCESRSLRQEDKGLTFARFIFVGLQIKCVRCGRHLEERDLLSYAPKGVHLLSDTTLLDFLCLLVLNKSNTSEISFVINQQGPTISEIRVRLLKKYE